MKTTFRNSAIAAIAMSAMAAPALADVTPQEIWDSWSRYFDSFGYTVTAAPQSRGSDLVISEMSLSVPIPAPGDDDAPLGKIDVIMGGVELIDNGDGSVQIVIPEAMPITIQGEGVEGEDFSLVMNLLTQAYVTRASGTPQTITYDTSAESITLAAVSFDGDEGLKQVPGKIEFTMQKSSGSSVIDMRDGMIAVTQDFDVGSLFYDVDIVQTEGDDAGTLLWKGAINNMVSTSELAIPDGIDMTNISAAMKAGYSVQGSLTYDSGNGGIDFKDDEEQFKIATSSNGGAILVSMDSNGIAYDVTSTGLTLHVEGKDVPFPIDTTIGQTRFGLSFPVEARTDEQTFSATIGLTDVAVPEMVWMMADPTGALPHDPVTVEIALSGNGILTADIMDEQQMIDVGMSGMPPGQINGVKLDKLLVKAAGAMISADADMVVDNNGKSVFNPAMPAFGGTANLRLTGVTGLIEKLSQMGLIPPGPAMMSAGMIKQMGKQESGPDDLSAVLFLSPTGELTVNGVPFPLQ